MTTTGPAGSLPSVDSRTLSSVDGRRASRPRHSRAKQPVDFGTQRKGRARRGIEWIIIIATALLVAFVVKTFALQAFFIPSGSMEPTLRIGDRILVDKISYDLHGVHRGDIVVFTNPDKNPSVKDLVKRVIGLPGDTISTGTTGQILIDGRALTEPYLPSGTSPGPPVHSQKVRSGYIFVMGDNRSNSEDSRYFGEIPESLIVGRVVMRVWPITAISFY